MTDSVRLLDPTSELESTRRARLTPPASLEQRTVALLDIGKARGDVFLDQLETQFQSRGINVARFSKPTNTRNAPTELSQKLASEADVVVEALSD